MIELKRRNLRDPFWQQADIRTPDYDVEALAEATAEDPRWLHIGPGNIFRGYIAWLQHDLLNRGETDRGIIAMSPSDPEKLHHMIDTWDLLTLRVITEPDRAPDLEIIGSVTDGVAAAEPDGWARALAIARHPGLQIISYTITEKGYNLRDMDGHYTPTAAKDLEDGPRCPSHTMATTAALLLERYRHGGHPITLVSMDNFTHNGDNLRDRVLEVAEAWLARGYVDDGFIAWLKDGARVDFPITVIDKIVPRPDPNVGRELEAKGIGRAIPITTSKGSEVAPYVNTERPQYLLIEDRFANGRPPLEHAGVIFAERETVDAFEKMKVQTCLNPLHTALAVTGCLLGHPSIAACMEDPGLVGLIRTIGYDEGLPVAVDPGVVDPKDFLDEVVNVRLPNPHTPDTPQRIAMDTSQKVGIRYGQTIQAYRRDPDRDPSTLRAIPAAIALWLRYLLGTDDEGLPMTLSSDPMIPDLQQTLTGLCWDDPDSLDEEAVSKILRNRGIFDTDLVEDGVAPAILSTLRQLLQGKGSVRRYLDETWATEA